MKNYEHYQVSPEDIIKHWELFGSLIFKAMDKGEEEDYTLEGAYRRLISSEWQLFVALDNKELSFIFVTCVIPYDLNKYLHSIYTAAIDGKKISFKYYDKCTVEIAKNFGCTKISGGGRKGWTRIITKYGYENKPLVVKKVG